MRELPKIDAHHHLWDLANPYPWLKGPVQPRIYGDYSAMCRNYLVDDFIADSKPHNVVKSVHVQANWDHSDPVGETRWCQGVADAHGFPHAIVAHADLSSPELEATLKAHAEFPNLRGIRHILGHTDDPYQERTDRPDHLSDPAWARGFATLADHGLSFDLQVFPTQMPAAAAIVRANPDVQVILVHTGFPYDRSGLGLQQWRDGMAMLADCPNVAVKLSGPCMVMPDWTVDGFQTFIEQTLALFGVDRCMFASNVPPDALAKPYGKIYEAFYAWAADYSEADQQKLFHDNAARIYRI